MFSPNRRDMDKQHHNAVNLRIGISGLYGIRIHIQNFPIEAERFMQIHFCVVNRICIRIFSDNI